MPGRSVGRLPDGPIPADGERFEAIARLGGVRIESIVSSAAPEPTQYLQDHDEWVLVLAGSATLDVDGDAVELTAGSWVFLPARVPHRVLRTDAGTRWLALHAGEGG